MGAWLDHPSYALSVESLQRINCALIEGLPHFVTIAEKGVALYRMEGMRLQAPRHLPAPKRAARGLAEYARWHRRGRNFLSGAAFYRDRGNAPMAALLLHQACEHFYLCVLWSITLHGPRTHALDELRETAEALDGCLIAAWPRETPFERRAFGCIRRAYVGDALADILYGSGLCPAIRGDTITVRYCDKSRPPVVATIEFRAQPDETVRLQVP